MELDIKKAFHSPFSEEKWYLKLIFPVIMAAFNLISNVAVHEHKIAVIILILITILPNLVLIGFFTQFAHNEIWNEIPLLPSLKSKIKQYFSYGIKNLGLSICYGIAFFIIGFVLSFVTGLVLGILCAILGLNKIILPIVSIIIFVPVLILLVAFMVLVKGAFADNFSFKEAMNYKRLFKLMSKVKSEIAIYLLLTICLTIALVIIVLTLSLLKFTLILAPILMAIVGLISINLYAQVYKIAKSRLENPQ